MIAGLKPYPAMKHSGVPWLGEVPEHWEVRRLKQAFRQIVGGSTPSSAEATFWDGDVVWITPADVSKTERLRNSLRRITREGLRSCSSELVPAGSIVVTSRAPVGNVALAEVDLCTNQGCKTLVTTGEVVNSLFGFHVLKTLKSELQSLATGTTFTEISTSRLGTVAMPLPPLPEQAAIIRFLDHADRRIRRYTRAKQKLIKLLEEQKQAIIHHTVTCGLDFNVRLKPSGLEWLGEVPEHWEVRRAKQLFREVDHRSTTGTEVLFSLRMYQGLVPHSDVSNIPITAEALIGFKKVAAGQVVMNRMRASIGMFGLAHQSGLVSPDYAVLEPRGSVDAEYYVRLFKTRAAGTMFRLESKGLGTGSSGFMRLYTDRFGIIKLPVPPREEQRSIVRGLAAETRDFDRTEERVRRELTLLREFRTRLIADVVTGKLDVRDAAARLPDEIEEPEPLDEAEVLTDAGEDMADDVDAAPQEAEA